MDLWFDGMTRPVRLHDNDSGVLIILRDIVGTWAFQEKPDEHDDPVITIWGHSSGVSRTSPWLDEPKVYKDPTNAACDFLVDLVHGYNADHPDQLCLHCAAVIIDDRLVIFPNGYNQGKSTFMTLLASRGIRMLCDDVMPLDLTSQQGMSLGLQPRLRCPIPTPLGNRFMTFVNDHSGPHSARFHFLKLGSDMLADFGETYPVGGVVILERNEAGDNIMQPVSQAEALKAIILRNFADQMPAPDILDGLCGLIEQSRLFKLNYSSGDTAAELLLNKFSSGQ